MTKPRRGEGGATALRARGYYAAFRAKLPAADFEFEYELARGPDLTRLVDVQWADWHRDGRLLVATTDGRLQIRSGDPPLEIVWEADMNRFTPNPQPPPPDASRW